MTTLLLSIIAAALLVMAALYWRQVQDEDRPDDSREDGRVSPLLRGINYLLSDEPDMALKEMVQVARLKSEAADVYMALGEMFRAKGEIGRAVRIHQNILARPDLPKDMHFQAHLALGKDFQTGGLLDRALKQYNKALMIQPDHIVALEACLRIREQSHEWVEAEVLLSRLEQLQGDRLHSHRAHLFAEMAEQDITENIERGEAAAMRALELDATCSHAYLVLIRMYLQQSKFEQVESFIHAMCDHTVEHLHLLIPVILKSGEFYHAGGKALMLQAYGDTKDEELALSWLEALAASGDKAELLAVKEQLQYVPTSLRASLRLAAIGDNGDLKLRDHARRWRAEMKHFACDACGIQIVDMRWQCPQCHAWGTMHAIREENL